MERYEHGSNYDTATTLIALVLASALVIYLRMVSPPKQKSLLGQVTEGAQTGCGLFVLFIVVLLLARLCGCG